MARPTAAQNERSVLILTGVGHFGTRWFELMFPTLAVALAHQQGLPLEQVLGWSFLGYQGTHRITGYVMCGLAVACAFLHVDEHGPRPAAAAGPPAAPSRRAALLLLFAAATLAGISYRGITLLPPAYFAQRVTEIGYGVAPSLAFLAGVVLLVAASLLFVTGDREGAAPTAASAWLAATDAPAPRAPGLR